MTLPMTDMYDWRGRDDDSGNTTDGTATWKAAARTEWNQDADDTFRIRILLEEINGKIYNNYISALNFNVNGGSWVSVGAATILQWADGTRTDGEDCPTSHLTSQYGGTRETTNAGYDDVNAQAGGATCDLVANGVTEMEFNLLVDSAQIVGTEYIEVRDYNAGAWSRGYVKFWPKLAETPAPTILRRPTNIHLRR